MTATGEGGLGVGAVALFDSTISNTDVAVRTATTSSTTPPSAGTLLLDNVKFQNVGQGVVHTSGNQLLGGGSMTVNSWGQGQFYDKNGGFSYKEGDLPAVSKSQVLLDGEGNFFTRPKPLYTDVDLGDFVSVKDEGAVGDGNADDTRALQEVINRYANTNKVSVSLLLIFDNINASFSHQLIAYPYFSDRLLPSWALRCHRYGNRSTRHKNRRSNLVDHLS